MGLKAGYEEHIKEFKRIYLALGISVTPKVLHRSYFNDTVFFLKYLEINIQFPGPYNLPAHHRIPGKN